MGTDFCVCCFCLLTQHSKATTSTTPKGKQTDTLTEVGEQEGVKGDDDLSILKRMYRPENSRVNENWIPGQLADGVSTSTLKRRKHAALSTSVSFGLGQHRASPYSQGSSTSPASRQVSPGSFKTQKQDNLNLTCDFQSWIHTTSLKTLTLLGGIG